MSFEWKGLTASHLKAFLEMELYILQRTVGHVLTPELISNP